MAKREVCTRCQRPLATCLCAYIVSKPSDYRLVILQDPKEARHALSSAPILARSIEGAALYVGDQFDPDALLGKEWRHNTLLVFPSEAPVTEAELAARPFTTVLLLDGTWRKVARLLHLNPWLRELPCLAINDVPKSRYKIRKSPRTDGLSTIEAAVYALNKLHPQRNYDAILGAFEKMIDLQIDAMGEEVYRRHYVKD